MAFPDPAKEERRHLKNLPLLPWPRPAGFHRPSVKVIEWQEGKKWVRWGSCMHISSLLLPIRNEQMIDTLTGISAMSSYNLPRKKTKREAKDLAE